MQTQALPLPGQKKGRKPTPVYPVARLRSIVKTTKTTVRQGSKIFQGISHSKQALGLMINLSRPEGGLNASIHVKPTSYFIKSGQRTDDNAATRDGYTADQVYHGIMQYMEIEKRKMRQPKFALDNVSKEDLAIEDEIRRTLYEDPSLPGVGSAMPTQQVFMQTGSASSSGSNQGQAPVQSVPTVMVGMLEDSEITDNGPVETEQNQEQFQLIEENA